MKKTLCLLLSLLLLLSCPAFAEEEDDLMIEEIFEGQEQDLSEPDPLWVFPVALEDMEPKYVVLVNKHYLLSPDFVPEPLVKMKQRTANADGSNKNGGVLFSEGGTHKLQETCAEALVQLSEAARADGYKLYLESAYRSYKTQKDNYDKRIKRNHGKDDGWVAKPGASDHQTGLGCDVIPNNWRHKSMNSKMAKEPECQWMAEHCQEYGFIIRYPEDKKDITEIHYEPWHLRYVGIPAATYIMERGICLEEFNDELQAAIHDYLESGGDIRRVEAFIQNPTEE